jgi:hypothetical protein
MSKDRGGYSPQYASVTSRRVIPAGRASGDGTWHDFLIGVGLGAIGHKKPDPWGIDPESSTPTTITWDQESSVATDPGTTVIPERSIVSSPTMAGIMAEAMPILRDLDNERQWRVLATLIDCRTSPDAPIDARIEAAFMLHLDGLISRGEIREMFSLSLYEYTALEERHISAHQEPMEF